MAGAPHLVEPDGAVVKSVGVATLLAALPPGVKDELVALSPPELVFAVAVADALVPAAKGVGVALPFPVPRGTKPGTKLFAEAARAAREVLAVVPPGVCAAGAGVDGREWVGVALAEEVVLVPVDEARALRCETRRDEARRNGRP